MGLVLFTILKGQSVSTRERERESLGKEKMAQNVGLRTFASVTNLLFELTREIRLMIFMSRDNWKHVL